MQALCAQDYPAFSSAELGRRRAALAAATDADAVLAYGAQRNGSAIQWFTGWPVTAEAAAVLTPGERDVLFVQYYNHVPLARRLAMTADVAWGGASTTRSAIRELKRRGARRVGVIGPVPFSQHTLLTTAFHTVIDLNPAYVDLRLVKSAEEIDWLRLGAALSDRAIEALRRELRAGLNERELANIVERAYVPFGGSTYIHYFGVTPMDDPRCCVPAQFPANRRIRAGDVVFTEISAAFWDYPGQVLRTFTVAAEPTPLYRDLHAVAEAAFDAIVAVLRPGARPEEILAAAAIIEDAGFTACDDLLHGFGGGYLPPVLSLPGRPGAVPPDVRVQAGMTLVVQPNVVTRDGRAGVQTGELVLVGNNGVERLHAAPRGLFQTDL